MKKIATHNSVTGERGRGLLSLLVAPFSKCQSKTIQEQYEAGARYFDIRYKWSAERDEYVCAHGLWESQKTLHEVLTEINRLGNCYVMLTCESGRPLIDETIKWLIMIFSKTKFTSFNIKHPEWKVVRSIHAICHFNAYKMLDWSSWHTLIPIPWLWKKIYFDNPEFNKDTFTMVDFL